MFWKHDFTARLLAALAIVLSVVATHGTDAKAAKAAEALDSDKPDYMSDSEPGSYSTGVLKKTGESHSRFYTYPDGQTRLYVLLEWPNALDPKTGKTLPNRLELEVTAGGKIYKGHRHVRLPGDTTTRKSVDLPTDFTGSGPVKVRVIANVIQGDGQRGNADPTDQRYTLFVLDAKAKPALGMPLTALVETEIPAGQATLGPGDPFSLRWRLRNVGNQPMAPFNAVITADPRDATITQPAGAYGAIAPNAEGNNTTPFRMTVKPNVRCGVPIQLKLTGEANGEPFILPFKVRTGRPAGARFEFYNNRGGPISSQEKPGRPLISKINVTGEGIIADLAVTLRMANEYSVQYVTIDLTSPDGTTVRLFDRRSTGGYNPWSVTFSDSAKKSISTETGPLEGSYRPEEPLSAFNGKAIKGVWKLTVHDNGHVTFGSLSGWTVSSSGLVCD
jgi:subtilisin-like proprotein convertase family protein